MQALKGTREKNSKLPSPGCNAVGVSNWKINFPCSPLSIVFPGGYSTLSSSRVMILPALPYAEDAAEDLTSLPETRSIIL